MRKALYDKVLAALEKAVDQGDIPPIELPGAMTIEATKLEAHGDWATNAALVLAKAAGKKPRDLAGIIIANLSDPEGFLEKMDIAGPGFINFTLSRKWWDEVVRRILRQKDAYGRCEDGRGRRVQVEFVSANPTGPLHVGHGRGAAIGDALARVLEAAGWEVRREYYVNDAGRQMRTLGRAVLYRYYQSLGKEVDFHKDLYQGEYIIDLARDLLNREGEKYLDLDEEKAVDEIYPWAADKILDGIKEDLAAFGIAYDRWFSEKSLFENDHFKNTLADLEARGHIYKEGGAVWFASAKLGDDKDRVLIKSSGENTYFATDIAYHGNKYQRGFDLVINLWGADHHGYIPRMKSAVEALGYDKSQLEILLVQLVNLLRGGAPVAMSTRAGEFVTLKEVVDEVGADAARFIFLTRSSDSPLDFDLEAAKAKSADNPVYYVQYAHARICSVFRNAQALGVPVETGDQVDLAPLQEEDELGLIKHLAKFGQVVQGAAATLEPHRLTHFLTELAKRFHPYYNRHRFIGEDPKVTRARLALAAAVKQVAASGLHLLGVSAPEKM
ncbi:MAG: arginine--tRNA ligase [Pseudomonadota bacterium]